MPALEQPPTPSTGALCMTKKFSLILIVTVMSIVTLFAEGETTKAAVGTLTLSKKSYKLAHAVAYESTTGGEEEVAVVLSAQPVSSEKLKKALAAEKEGGFGEFPQPFLRLVFKKTGELKHWSALGGGTTVGGSSDGTGELKLQDGHVVGKASAVIVSLHEDGDIFGCEVAHSALQHKNFSSIGSIHTNDFTFENGKVEGELTTDGQHDTFGETWEVKIKFVAPLGEIPKEYQVAK